MARADLKTTRRPFVTALKVAIYVALVGLLALIVAVAVAYANLPSYADLSKRSDLGQMIRVRAADGTVLVSLGPSFGRWLPYDEIPPKMRAAMIAVEDKRFRSTSASTRSASRARSRSASTPAAGARAVDHHPAARAQHLPDQQPHLRPQDEGSGAGAGDRAQVHARTRSSSSISTASISAAAPMASTPPAGPSSATAPTSSASAKRRSSPAWSRRRPTIRRPPTSRPPSAAPGVVLNSMVDERLHHAGRRRRRSIRPRSRSSRRQAEQRPLFHRLGAAPARHADRRDQRADRRVDDARSRHAGARPTGRSTPTRRPARKARWSRSTATARCGRWSAAATMSIRSTTAPPRPSASRAPRSSCSSISPRSRSGMKPTDTIVDEPVDDRRLDARATRPAPIAGPVTPARGLRALDQHHQRQDRRPARLWDHRRHGAALRHQQPDLDLSRRWCWARATCA